MSALRVAAVVFSLVVLAAHFLRAGNLLLCGGSLALHGLLAIRKPWARRALQLALGLGALEWLRMAFDLAEARVRAGEPWERMAIILVSVAVVAGLAAVGLEAPPMRRRFEGEGASR